MAASVGGIGKLTPEARLLRIIKRQASQIAKQQKDNNKLVLRCKEAENKIAIFEGFLDSVYCGDETIAAFDEYRQSHST